MAALMRRTPVALTVAADNPVTIDGLDRAGRLADRPVGVVIECDTGASARAWRRRPKRAARCRGRAPAGAAVPRPDVLPAGGRLGAHAALLRRDHGGPARPWAAGGYRVHRRLAQIPNAGRLKGQTEHRPGTYIFNDRMQVKAGVAALEDCALTIVSTVVSRAGADRGILDAGSKTLTTDTGGLDGHGHILEHPKRAIARFAEEHGFLDLSACNDRPNVGDVVRIIPNHVCVVVNMMDRLIAVRGEGDRG